MIITKKACITTSFYCAYLTFIVFSMFGHIPTIGGYLKTLTNFGLLAFALIICLRLKDYSIQEAIIFAIYLLFSLLSALNTGDYGFFKLGIMIFACKGLDFKSIIRKDLYTRIVLVIIMFFLWLKGIAPDITSYYNGSIRHSMGFQNPNHVGIMSFVIIMEILYLSRMRLTILKYITIFIIIFIEDYFAGSRTAELITLISVGLATIYSFWPKFFEKQMVKSILSGGAAICSILTAISFFMLKSGYSLAIALDKVLSYRITNIVFYYNAMGISLLGKNPISLNRTIDSIYGFTFIVLGLFAFAFIIIMYRKLEHQLIQTDMQLAIIMFCFFVYGLSERLWMYVDYNIFMLAFACLIYPSFTTTDNRNSLSVIRFKPNKYR